jgi:hypothetical protein
MISPSGWPCRLLVVFLVCYGGLSAHADHIQVPDYQSLETTYSRLVTTNPFSGMRIYRVEYRGTVAAAYRICFDEEERFPFAVADFATDILYLDRNRDGHMDEMVAPATLQKRNLTDDLPSCKPSGP